MITKKQFRSALSFVVSPEDWNEGVFQEFWTKNISHSYAFASTPLFVDMILSVAEEMKNDLPF